MYFSDTKISERHLLLKATIDTLTSEDEAYEQAFYMSWVFLLSFILIGLGQIILFYLYNKKCHPFSIILPDDEKGKDSSGI